MSAQQTDSYDIGFLRRKKTVIWQERRAGSGGGQTRILVL
jgi:hypothetical protein